MLGLSLAYLPKRTLEEAAESFLALQREYPLRACELHMEAIQFSAGFWYWDRSVEPALSGIRRRVDVLGVHLPYLDMNPISPNPRIARVAIASYRSAIGRAASLGADYMVFHARGSHGLDASRECEVECWRRVVGSLMETAERHGVAFCFENADDVRLISEAAQILDADPRTRMCLDLGHLFERIQPASAMERIAAKLSDRLLPGTAIRRGVPFYEAGDLNESCRRGLSCVHVHNHDGTSAHRPLTEGKADIGRIIRDLGDLSGIPVVLEADYRHLDMQHVRKDITLLKGLLD